MSMNHANPQRHAVQTQVVRIRQENQSRSKLRF